MYKELVERLRKMYTLCAWDELKDASNAIEKLIFKYNFANMTKKETDIALKNEFLKSLRLEAENKQLKRERDQAVEDLKINSKCSICKNNPKGKDARKCKYYDTCGTDNCWQWRGVQEENNETD